MTESVVRYACPSCSEPMKARHADVGKPMSCPHCDHKHKVPSPPTELTINADSVAHEYLCPSCGESIKTSLKMIGRNMPCPHCARNHVVPEAPAPSE